MVANLNDNTNSWDLMPSGKYIRRATEEAPFSAHNYFMQNPSLSGRGSSLEVSAPKELDIKKPKAQPKTIEKAVNAK